MTAPSTTSGGPNSHNGDEEPWQPFVEGLRAFIKGRVPSVHADDVLQDALVRMHESAASTGEIDRAEAWVFAIARRTIADFYRERERGPEEKAIGRAEEMAGPAENPEAESTADYDGEHDVHEEVLSWLRPMAEKLPEMYRRPLVMADFEGHTQQEVADELGLSLSGAKSRVQRARKKLGRRLKDCCEVEFGTDGRAREFRRREGEA